MSETNVFDNSPDIGSEVRPPATESDSAYAAGNDDADNNKPGDCLEGVDPKSDGAVDTGEAQLTDSSETETSISSDTNANTVDTPKVELSKPSTWTGKSARDDIDRRQQSRKRIAREGFAISQPNFTDEDSIKAYVKKLKAHREQYWEACYLIDYDLDLYRRAFSIAVQALADEQHSDDSVQSIIERISNVIFAQAYEEVPMSMAEREQQEKEREAAKKAELDEENAKRKAAGAPEQVEGQLAIPFSAGKKKIKGDDGSCAEAASECFTRSLSELEENDDAPPEIDDDHAKVFDNDGNEIEVPPGELLEGEPLLLTEEERSTLPELEPITDDSVESVLGISEVLQPPMTEEQHKEWDRIANANSKNAAELRDKAKALGKSQAAASSAAPSETSVQSPAPAAVTTTGYKSQRSRNWGKQKK